MKTKMIFVALVAAAAGGYIGYKAHDKLNKLIKQCGDLVREINDMNDDADFDDDCFEDDYDYEEYDAMSDYEDDDIPEDIEYDDSPDRIYRCCRYCDGCGCCLDFATEHGSIRSNRTNALKEEMNSDIVSDSSDGIIDTAEEDPDYDNIDDISDEDDTGDVIDTTEEDPDYDNLDDESEMDDTDEVFDDTDEEPDYDNSDLDDLDGFEDEDTDEDGDEEDVDEEEDVLDGYDFGDSESNEDIGFDTKEFRKSNITRIAGNPSEESE